MRHIVDAGRSRRLVGIVAASALALSACGSDEESGGTATGSGEATKDVTVGFAQANFGNGW